MSLIRTRSSSVGARQPVADASRRRPGALTAHLIARRVLLVLASTLLPLSAHADTFYRLIGYRCDARANQLVVTYRGAYNEAGEAMKAAKAPGEQDPMDLLTAVDESHFGPGRTIEARCVLRHVAYRIKLGPSPQNANAGGQCGGEVGAWVEVTRGADAKGFRREMEPWCHSDDPVTTRIVFRPGAREPVLTTVANSVFFK